jgi:hypothetical protein
LLHWPLAVAYSSHPAWCSCWSNRKGQPAHPCGPVRRNCTSILQWPEQTGALGVTDRVFGCDNRDLAGPRGECSAHNLDTGLLVIILGPQPLECSECAAERRGPRHATFYGRPGRMHQIFWPPSSCQEFTVVCLVKTCAGSGAASSKSFVTFIRVGCSRPCCSRDDRQHDRGCCRSWAVWPRRSASSFPCQLRGIVVFVALALLALKVFGSCDDPLNVPLASFGATYVAAALLARPNVGGIVSGTFLPAVPFDRDLLSIVVAIIGTLGPTSTPGNPISQADEKIEEGKTWLSQRIGASDSDLAHSQHRLKCSFKTSRPTMPPTGG